MAAFCIPLLVKLTDLALANSATLWCMYFMKEQGIPLEFDVIVIT